MEKITKEKSKKILLKITLVSIVLMLILYIFTPFGKKKVGGHYYKDLFFVYYVHDYLFNFEINYFGDVSFLSLTKIIKGGNPWKFEIVDCLNTVAKDNKRVYFLKNIKNEKGFDAHELTIFDNIDASLFRMEGGTQDGKRVCSRNFEAGNSIYYSNLNNLVFLDGFSSSSSINLNTMDGRILDGKNYYCDDKRYEFSKEPKLFDCSNEYVEDADKIYYIGTSRIGGFEEKDGCFSEIEVADMSTFEACGIIGKDKNNLYFGGKIVSTDDGLYDSYLGSYNTCFQGQKSKTTCLEKRNKFSDRSSTVNDIINSINLDNNSYEKDDLNQRVEIIEDEITTRDIKNKVSDGCYDSDGGKNYSKKGVSISASNNVEFQDRCDENDGKLIESYCNGEYVNFSSYKCPNGCDDGRCI